jgi:DNA helicase-2/ATP-dependent DNA helicase PcrA
VLVIAGAGTGKTKALTAAVAHCISARGIQAGRLLAATFTNKDAAEMTGRIREELGGDAAPRGLGVR